jgi:glycosyltransferase involved in cell wall biosynthesis
MPIKSPLISVIVPAYNEDGYIQKCLKSLLKQDIDKKLFEVIVVDNSSEDKTADLIKAFPVKYLYESKRSVVAARERGTKASKGKIIVSADADTVYPHHWLSRIKKVFQKNPDAIAVVGWVYFDDTTPFFNYTFALTQQFNAFIKRFSRKFPLVYAANFAFKKEALDAIGGYPKHLPELGDQQYLLYNFFKIGNVLIDKRAYCITSGRRHSKKFGDVLIYNGWYRIVGYMINRLLGRQLIGPAPAIRKIEAKG